MLGSIAAHWLIIINSSYPKISLDKYRVPKGLLEPEDQNLCVNYTNIIGRKPVLRASTDLDSVDGTLQSNTFGNQHHLLTRFGSRTILINRLNSTTHGHA